MSLRRVHAWSAVLLAAFAFGHLANHLAGLAGVEAHIAFMRAFRAIYRAPMIEFALLAAIVVQVVTGLTFVVRGWRQRRGFVPWLHAGSGAYLALFLLNHTGAMLYARNVLDLDTNIYFGAAGFHVPPFQFFFAPYYFLAVLALFTHLGCALYWQLPDRPARARGVAIALPVAVGLVLSSTLVLMLAGVLVPIEIPAEYTAIYGVRP